MALARKPGRSYTLYRFYGDDDLLLYVGITWTPHLRLRKHELIMWWSLVRTIRVQHFDEVNAAEGAEDEAIRRERPVFNTRGNQCVVPGCGGPARSVLLCGEHYAQAPAGARIPSVEWLRQLIDWSDTPHMKRPAPHPRRGGPLVIDIRR